MAYVLTPVTRTPYPDYDEPKDIPRFYKDGYEHLERFTVPRFATVAALEAAIPTPVEGMVAHLAGTGLVRHTGATWSRLREDADVPPQATLVQTAAQNVANATWAAILFQGETLDTHNGHDVTANTSRYTAPRTGRYLVSGRLAWAANATGRRLGRFLRNSSATQADGTDTEIAAPATGASSTVLSLSATLFTLQAGDFVEMQGLQESGLAAPGLATAVTTTTIRSRMDVLWVAPA